MMNKEGFGIAIGLLIWGVAFLALPKFVGMIAVLSWGFYSIGFALLLIGIMGACIEFGKRGKTEK